MLLALLILAATILFGRAAAGKIFKTDLFPVSLLFGVLGFTWILFLASLALGFNEIPIVISVIIILILALFLQNWKFEFRFHEFFRKDSLIIFFISALFLTFSALKSIDTSDGISILSQDWAVHLGIVSTFSQGNFPPDYPYYSQSPFTYYYFMHLFVASLVKGGLGLFTAFQLSLVLLISATITALYSFSRDLLKGWKGGLLSVLMIFIVSACTACLISDVAWLSPFFSFSEKSGFPLRPLMLSYPFNQLPIAISFLFFAIYLRMNIEMRVKNKLILLGMLIALFPMFGPFYMALLFIFISYGILFERSREFLYGAALAFAGGALQYALLLAGETRSTSILQFARVELFAHAGSVPDLLLFWLQNAGGHIILATLGIVLYLKNRQLGGLFISSALLFILANFIIVFPDSWANEKFFLPFLVLSGIYAAAFLSNLINSKSIAKYIAYLIIILGLLSAIHQFKLIFEPSGEIVALKLGDPGMIEACEWIKANTPPKSVFIAPPELEGSGCIYIIGGRLVYYSNPYWIRSQGFDGAEASADQERMLSGDVTLAKDENVEYIFADAGFERRISSSLRENLDRKFSNPRVAIYQLR